MKVGRLIWRPCRLSVVVVMGNILGTGWGAISGAPGDLLDYAYVAADLQQADDEA